MCDHDISCVVFITKSNAEYLRFPGDGVNSGSCFAANSEYKVPQTGGCPTFVVINGEHADAAIRNAVDAVRKAVGRPEPWDLSRHVEGLCDYLLPFLQDTLARGEDDVEKGVLVCVHWGKIDAEPSARLDCELNRLTRGTRWRFHSYSSTLPDVIDVSAGKCPVVLPTANFDMWFEALDHGLHIRTSWNAVCNFVASLRLEKGSGESIQQKAFVAAAVDAGLLQKDGSERYSVAYENNSCIAWILQKAGVDKFFAELIKDGQVTSFSDDGACYDKMLKDLDAAMEFPSPRADVSAAQKVGQQLSETQSAGTKFAENNKAEGDKADTPVTRIGKGRLLAGMVWVNSILLLLLILPFVLVCVREHVVCPPMSKQSSPYGSSVSWSEASAAHCPSTNDCATCAGNNPKNSKPHVADPVRSAGVGLCRILALAFAGFLYVGACSIMTAWGRGAYKAYVRRCREDEARWIADRLSHENGTEMEQVHRKMLAALMRNLSED